MSFAASGVSFAAGGRPLVSGVNLAIEPGTVHALLGANGAGKTTLLRLMAGDLAPASGSIELNRRPLGGWSDRERARQRAVLPQSESLRFGFTAEQVVALGRLPCPRHSRDREREIVRQALSAAGVAHLAQRKYPTLSGGERARVQFARVMAQIWEPVERGARYLLLDEPTASLDLAHQHECLAMARCFAADGAGVLSTLHDPNLALRHADTATVLRDGRVLATGTPLEVLTPETVREAYGVTARLLRAEGEALPYLVVVTGTGGA